MELGNSCSSSSVSSQEHSTGDTTWDDCQGTQPHLFEPYDSEASSDTGSTNESDEEEFERLQNTDWWKLPETKSSCRMQLTVSWAKTMKLLREKDQPNPPFASHSFQGSTPCVWIAWFYRLHAWYQYKQQYQDSYEGPSHKQNRHIAYRQLARWCWGLLGKEVRVVVLSCAVCCIRAHFPPQGLEDFIFEGFNFPDE